MNNPAEAIAVNIICGTTLPPSLFKRATEKKNERTVNAKVTK